MQMVCLHGFGKNKKIFKKPLGFQKWFNLPSTKYIYQTYKILMILTELNDIIEQNNKLVLHIYDEYNRIYVVYFENNRWSITRNRVNIYFTEKYKLYSLLIKLNIQSIDKYNDIEYLIQCRYYIHKITIIQRSISFFSNHSEHHAWCVSALQHEQNKLEQMKQQYPEYFL